MVGLSDNTRANGMAGSDHVSHGTEHHDMRALLTELIAAANYLQGKIGEEGLSEKIERAASNSDALEATNTLADAFIKALNAPEDPDGSGSLEGCMQELLLWVKKECAMNNELVEKISEGLCSGVSSGDLRLRCMALLYNAVSEDHISKRFHLLAKTITLASSVGLVSKIVDTILPKVDVFLRQWKTSVPDKRYMYKVCYEALKLAGMSQQAFQFNVKQLALYNGATQEEMVSAESATVDVIVQAVRLPKLYRFDTLLELDTVKRFENHSEFNLLYQLISIFVRDELVAFTEFRASHGQVLTKYEIDPAIAEDKMRLLTFASLGIESQDLTYSMIASSLQIPESEVENWVIKAISSGLIDAKINQLKSSVAIYRSTQRMFTREEWQPLSERINIWKENIGDLLGSLRETRESSTRAAAEAFSG